MQGFIVCCDPLTGQKTIIAQGQTVYIAGDCDIAPSQLSQWQENVCLSIGCEFND